MLGFDAQPAVAIGGFLLFRNNCRPLIDQDLAVTDVGVGVRERGVAAV